MKWDNLTMSQRSELMKLYLKHGITSLDSMRAHYNSFADGGKIPFKVWKAKMKAKYPDIEMENDKAGYDYEAYFTNNYEDAIRQLSNLQHFPDTYKLPNHPTFSNESIYSRGPMMGGSWVNDTTFTPSVINRQYHPNIYRKDRDYTEREIYGHKFGDGGPKKLPYQQANTVFNGVYTPSSEAWAYAENDKFNRFIDYFGPRWEAAYRRNNPNASDDEVNNAVSYLLALSAHETQYGLVDKDHTRISEYNNLGGDDHITRVNGREIHTPIRYVSVDSYMDSKLASLNRLYPRWNTAQNYNDFVDLLFQRHFDKDHSPALYDYNSEEGYATYRGKLKSEASMRRAINSRRGTNMDL